MNQSTKTISDISYLLYKHEYINNNIMMNYLFSTRFIDLTIYLFVILSQNSRYFLFSQMVNFISSLFINIQVFVSIAFNIIQQSMEQSLAKSQFLTTMSSNKSYLVKRKKLQLNRTKQAKGYFHTPNYNHETFGKVIDNNTNVSTVSIDYPDNNDNDNSQNICQNLSSKKFTKISLSNDIIKNQTQDVQTNSLSDQFSLENCTKNDFARQRASQSLIDSHNLNKIKQKKITFSTICDASFNKSLTKKEIIIQDPSANPQALTSLPKINKSISQKKKTLIYEKLKLSQIPKNNLIISEDQPYHLLSKQMADKFSIEKFHHYKKLWASKHQKRKQINSHIKNSRYYKSFSFNASVLEKSELKSTDIAIKYNEDAEHKRQRCFWEQELRGNKRKYVTIGETSSKIKGLKGHGQYLLENIEVIPVHSIEKNNFLCQQVYKYHK